MPIKTYINGKGETCYDLQSMHKGNRFRLMFGLPLLEENNIMQPPKLIAVTKPVEQMTAEEFIAYQARVTSPQNQDNHDTSFKLLKYCLVNGHWSPFDMVDMTIEVNTSRAIMAQILRHWSFRFQEFSQRYAPVGDGVEPMDWTHLEARSKASSNRQGSGERLPDETFHLMQSCKASEAGYYDLLKHGVAPECARMALPLGVETRAYMKGSVRTWITYLWQRSSFHHTHAQKEHRMLADQIAVIFGEVFPNISNIVEDGMPVYLTKAEIEVINGLRKHNNPIKS